MKWEKVKLGNLFQIKHGWAFKGEYFSNEGELIIVTPGNFFEKGGFRQLAGKEKFYLGEFPNEFLLKKNDVIIAMTEQGPGLLGSPAIVPSDEKYLHNQRIGLIHEIKDDKADPMYIYRLFFTSNVRNEIFGSATGTKVKHTAPKRIYDIEINLPPLPIQRKIASILSAYDDLIENNLKRVKLLEEATRNSYKQFKKETINEWISGSFSDFFKINNGCAFKAEWYVESGVSIIRTRDYSYSKFLNVGQPIFIDDFQAENFSKFLLKEYDFMLIMVGASIGRYGIILPKDLPALQNQNQWALREIKEYCYLKVIKLLLIEEVLENLLQQRTGAARDFFRSSFLNELEVRVPPEKSGKELNSILENSFNQINVLQNQNTKLREARDVLLPKLMNGQIEV
jgi:type I restriction enzyme, S subunit